MGPSGPGGPSAFGLAAGEAPGDGLGAGMTMSGGRDSDGVGHGAGTAVPVGPAVPPGTGGTVGPVPTGGVTGVAVAAGHDDPGGTHGLSGVGTRPAAHAAPGGPTIRPSLVGLVNAAALVPATAAFMNRCQMVAGRVPPETSTPWTLVICGVFPVLGSVV